MTPAMLDIAIRRFKEQKRKLEMTPTDPQRREAVEASYARIREAIMRAAGIFAAYELMHLKKTPPDKDKADRNAQEAVKLLGLAGDLNIVLSALTPPPVESEVAPHGDLAAALEWLKADKRSYEYGVANGDRGARDYDKIIARYNALITAAQAPSVNAGRMEAEDLLKKALEKIRDYPTQEDLRERRIDLPVEDQYDINKKMRNIAKSALAAYNIAKGGKS